MLIHYNDLYSPALHKTLTVMKLTILVDPSLVIIDLYMYLIQLIHALVWTKRGEEILHVQYMTMPQEKNPCSRGISIYNFCQLLLGHDFYTLNLSDLC